MSKGCVHGGFTIPLIWQQNTYKAAIRKVRGHSASYEKMAARVSLDDEKKRLTNERLKTAKDNIYENALHLLEKEMDRQLQAKLHMITSQASHLRQKIKVFNLERRQARLEIKKRYFPEHDFRHDESQLEQSMNHLGLHFNHFYLNKKQRYPIRAKVNESPGVDAVRSHSTLTCNTKELKRGQQPQTPVSIVTRGSKREFSSRKSEIDPYSEISTEPTSESSLDQYKTLPELLISSTSKEQKWQKATNINKHIHTVNKFSVLLDPDLKKNEEADSKFPVLQNKKLERKRELNQGNGEADLEDTSLPNIDGKALLIEKNVSKYRNTKEQSARSNISAPQVEAQFNTSSHESMKPKGKIDNYFQSKQKNDNLKTNGISEYPYRETVSLNKQDSSSKIRNVQLSTTVGRHIKNSAFQSDKYVEQNHNWRITKPLKKSHIFMDKIALVTMAGFPGTIPQNLSVIPLNAAKRALRHTPTFKIQAFIKQLVAQRTRGQQFEVNKLQSELDIENKDEVVKKPCQEQEQKTAPSEISTDANSEDDCTIGDEDSEDMTTQTTKLELHT